MPITYDDLLLILWIIVAVMIVVVLYHLLFILVDVRKITRRIDNLTEQIEAVVTKPLSLVDQMLNWTVNNIEGLTKKVTKKKGKKDFSNHRV